MNLKRISAAALATVLTASMLPAALAAERPEGWTPADGARGPMLISPNPNADDAQLQDDDGELAVISSGMPTVDIAAPNGGYKTSISVNGVALESFDFDCEVPGWGSQSVTWKINELDAVPAGYVPMRAIAQADYGSCYWDKEGRQSWFSLGDHQITVFFDDMSVTVNDEPAEGVSGLLLSGVTYLPVSVIDGLEGFEVEDLSANGVESYNIKTPNGEPVIMLAHQLMDVAGIGYAMQSTPAELEEFYGESLGFKAEYMTEGVVFLPMMTTPDTLILGKLAEGKEEALKEALEAYRKQQEDTFSWYLVQNLPKVENAKFVTSGEWFMFLIAENADEAVATFESAVASMAE